MRVLPLLPVPIVTLVLVVFRPGLLIGGASSLRGLLVMAGVGVAGLVVLAALWRRSQQVALWSATSVVLALMAVLLWPAFRERTVVEVFPPVVEAAATASPAATAAPTATASTRAPVVTVPTPVVTKAPAATKPPPTKAPAASAVRLASGSFRGINHHAEGRASLYAVGGSYRIRFEEIDFEGTPGPSVRLVKAGARTPKGGIRLGGLKGEHGSFSYPVPSGFDPSKGWTVLVWCDPYDTGIAAADLS